MSWIDEILNFLEDYTDISNLQPDSDLYGEMGITGDDFHEMIENFAKNYEVDMSEYLWYFHSDEEGHNFGSVFFKTPYERVNRIPVTPKLLADSIESKKWSLQYPPHQLPKRRIDLTINLALIILVIVILIYWLLFE